MPFDEHILERRARILADGILARKALLVNALAPPGKRQPFTTQLSKPEALAFWQRNRHSALGRQVLERMKPEDILELDLALAQTGEGNGTPGPL